MRLLIRQAKIFDPQSEFHHQVKDILIVDGIIEEIGENLNSEDVITIDEKGLCISNGWVDLKAHFCDPGEEHKETIKKGLEAAALGGFTHVGLLPSTQPVVDNKAQVNYIFSEAENEVCEIHPYACITKGMKGEELAEMYDMHLHGVRQFTDDTSFLSSGILYRALLYSKNFGAKIIAMSRDMDLSKGTQVNEGIASTLTGLKGDPEISETITLERNLRLLEYTGGNLHVTGVSSAESVKLIENAKKKGLNITADTHLMQILFDESEVENFDVNYKVLPVLRTNKDKEVLIEALRNNILDGLASDHRPMDTEEKDIEFDNASFGNIQLQTVFSSLLSSESFSLDEIIDILALRNRNLLGLLPSTINKGHLADLTLFNPEKDWTFEKQDVVSYTANTPFLNKKFKGTIVGIVNKGKFALKELEVEKG